MKCPSLLPSWAMSTMSGKWYSGGRQGYTICFIPDEYTNPYNLALHPLRYADGTPVWRNTWLLWSKDKRISTATEAFVRFIASEHAE